MTIELEKDIATGPDFVHKLSTRLGMEGNRGRTERIIRKVLHILRERLTIEESMQVIAQLPIVLKGWYVHGWSPDHKKSRSKTIGDLAREIALEDRAARCGDFYGQGEVILAIRAFMETLADGGFPGEIEEMIDVMPPDLKHLMASWLLRYR